jgi:choline dehydrogenase-like flavoprotein
VLIDARSVADQASLECDLCIVGAGAAGIAVADRLLNSGLKICLVESGGEEPHVRTQNLYRGRSTGHPYFRLNVCRFRMLGGSTNRWGGWCRPLDPIDFEQREWVSDSGWPIDELDLAPFSQAAAALLRLPTERFDLDYWHGRMPPPFPLQGGAFENSIVQYSPQVNFWEEYGAGLRRSPAVTVLAHANVTEILLEPRSSRVRGVRVRTLAGREFEVAARAVVLATGGIENARLLLASREARPAGLGNEHDLVGRHFMEHLHVRAGHLVPARAAVRRDFYARPPWAVDMAQGFITPTADAQRRLGLLSCSISVEAASHRIGTSYLWPPEILFGPVRLYRKLSRGRAAPLAGRLDLIAENAYQFRSKLVTGRAARRALRTVSHRSGSTGTRVFSLYVRAEQAPDPSSRLTLDRSRDALGMPQVVLDWRVSDRDTDSVLAWLSTLAEEIAGRRLGLVVPPSPDLTDGIIGGPHHMGTTRMSAEPRRGVVDEQCRVHSLDNLYVAGSSVFATGGYANPTLTIVALALRLADHLRAGLV